MGADEGRAAGTSAIPLRSQRVSPDGGTIGKKWRISANRGGKSNYGCGANKDELENQHRARRAVGKRERSTKNRAVLTKIITRKQGEKKVEWRIFKSGGKRGAAAKLRIFGSTTPDRKHQSL